MALCVGLGMPHARAAQSMSGGSKGGMKGVGLKDPYLNPQSR